MKIGIRFKWLGIHILAILLFVVLAVAGTFWWLDRYTRHGDAVTVPDVDGYYYADAEALLEECGIHSLIIDSLYVDGCLPGAVIDQVPGAGSVVKHGRTIYLTINALSPRKVAIPKLTDLSFRQALIILNGLGFPEVEIEYEDSEYKDLVLALLVDGEPIEPGEKVSEISALTLVVGTGHLSVRRKITPQDTMLLDFDMTEFDNWRQADEDAAEL